MAGLWVGGGVREAEGRVLMGEWWRSDLPGGWVGVKHKEVL